MKKLFAVLLCVSVMISMLSISSAPVYASENSLVLNQETSVLLGEEVFTFKPEYDGYYIFKMYSEDDVTLYCNVYDGESYIEGDSYRSYGKLTEVTYLSADRTYYYEIDSSNDVTVTIVIGEMGSDLMYDYVVLDDDTAEIVGYMGNETVIEIPSTLGGHTVTGIGDNAFEDCYNLTKVIIPDTVINIGYSAFSGCYDLISVTIGNSVKSIGDFAFGSCNSLTAIIIPDSVTSLGDFAFRSCNSLTAIIIPDSVTSLGDYVFSGCDALTSVSLGSSVNSIGQDAFRLCTALASIVIDEDNQYFDSRNDCNAIIETASNTLIVGCDNTIIPNSVTSIGDSAFESCYNIETIIIPDSVESIGYYAFHACESLTEVIIGDSVKSIGGYAFRNCYSLMSVTIPANVTEINASFGHTFNWSDGYGKIEGFTIYGYNNTEAERYAKDSGFEFVAIDVSDIMGDVDGDNEVTILDATDIQRYCACLCEFSAIQIRNGDVNGDGKLTVMDATHIQRFLASLSCSELVGTHISKN